LLQTNTTNNQITQDIPLVNTAAEGGALSVSATLTTTTVPGGGGGGSGGQRGDSNKVPQVFSGAGAVLVTAAPPTRARAPCLWTAAKRTGQRC